MKGYYYLNFSDLSEEAQNQLMEDSKDDLLDEDGEDTIREEAKQMNIDYETLLQERAERHMNSFDFVFNV